MKGIAMKAFKLSLLVTLLCFATTTLDSQVPDCGANLNGTLKIGMVFLNGLPWETFQNGAVSGFDVEVACQIQHYAGYSDIEFVNLPDTDAVFAAVADGTVTLGISKLQIEAGTPAGISFVKYSDFIANSGSQGTGIAVSSSCCQLYVNVAAVIAIIAANGTLKSLADEFGIVPDTLTPTAGLVPAGCTASAALPVRNALSTFILQKYCLPNCNTTNVVNPPTA